MNRGFQAPMDLDDKSSFIGWESPAIAPLIANVETASTATAKRNKAKTSDQVTEAKSTAIGASDSSERQKPTRASKIDNDRIRRENLRKDSTDQQQHQQHQQHLQTANSHNLGGLFSSQQNLLQQPSAMASSSSIAGMPQFGVAAGAAQMHHHYYGVNVPGIHSSHVAANDFVVDRNLRRTAANGRGSGGIGTGYTDVGNKMDEDDDDDGE
ncbi:hypothetical protein HK100_012533 [Physocladia obscura]|uniref:Uncharacterized protein n=1 Tax=Physocladia obscura TaxID=109957 RepID=A0AAD5T9U4_9FUNG|nr:hypothetical protein HK100_012533 [Physocladia obscura]